LIIDCAKALIVAILAAIALPSYSDYAKRGKIPDATSNLAAQRVKLEQYFQDSKTYTGAPTCIANDTTTSTNFTFACTVTLGGLGYTLSATGVGSMLGFVYTVDQTNARTTAAVPAGWTAPTPNNCWVTSKSGSC